MNHNDTTCETLTIDDSDLETISTDDDEVQIVGTVKTSEDSQQNRTHNQIGTKRHKNRKKARLAYKEAFKDNRVLLQFVEKCLQLDPRSGMYFVIHKTLIPIYLEADKEYVKSRSFEKYITKHLKTLNSDPKHKYTHLKTLCESLKLHKFKKRVKLITLSTKLNGNSPKKRQHSLHNTKDSTDIIDLNDEIELPQNEPVIAFKNNNVHEEKICGQTKGRHNNKTQIGNSFINTSVVSENQSAVDNTVNSNNNIRALPLTEKAFQDQNQPKNSECEENNLLVPQIFLYCNNQFVENNEENINNGLLSKSQKDYNQAANIISRNLQHPRIESEVKDFLRRHSCVNGNIDSMGEEEKARKILEIELKIAHVKGAIAQLEEEEVCHDSIDSPYIVCEKLKKTIVHLYKYHCKLTGSQVVKRRVIRLQVLQGHPAGPVRRLEEFLNNNIGEDGDVPFPDLDDVIKCVMQANVEDGLCWQKAQIEKEARSLFIQCGRALQKRRQEREWRDLLYKVKLEKCEEDPADRDPQLFAKLERNRKLAARKERSLLQRFTYMQAVGINRVSNLSKDNMEDTGHTELLNDSLSMAYNNSSVNNSHLSTSTSEINDSTLEIDTSHTIKSESFIEIEIAGIPESPAIKTENEGIVNEESSISTNLECAAINNSTEESKSSQDVNIKEEPTQDIVARLNELGDNYTTTVLFDFDEPQLVIEISDSSDDECI